MGIFGVAHILATWNDTFIHVTDLTGRETYCRVTGGMMVTSDREESSPYAAMMAAAEVSKKLKEIGVNAVHIKLRARTDLKIGRIEDVTPIPTDSTRRAGG